MKYDNKKKVFMTLTFAAAVCCARAAHAAYDDVGVGARVTGLGSAYTAIADDSYAVYYNPAGLGTLERPHLATTYSRLLTGLSDGSNLQNSFVTYGKPIRHGRQGAWGMAWNYFTLDSLYKEMSIFGSYGRRIFAEQAPNGLYAGMTLKYLHRSLGSVDSADNAFNSTGMRLGEPDPVIQKGSKTNFDTDLGLLYRWRPRVTFGLAAQHMFEPNIAFADDDTDKLGRNVKLGAAYQTPWTSFSGDLDFLKAPDGSTDKVATAAVEKWLPTLLHGTFGVRTSIGVGSRQYRRITAGLSYRIHKMQVDYGFSIPLGGVSSTFGTHRMGLSFRFGRPREAEPKFSEAILENMQELAEVGAPRFRAQAEALALYKRTAQREFLRQAQVDTGEGRFADAKSKLYQALGLNPKDRGIQASYDRMGLAAEEFPELPGFRTDPAQAAAYEGILDFVAGRDEKAVRKLVYAQSLDPGEERYERLLQVVERTAGITRTLPERPGPRAAPTMGKEKVVGANMALLEAALREGAYDRVIELADRILSLDGRNSLAYKRKGAALYAKKRYNEALKALRLAYKYETQSEARRTLRQYIDALVSLITRKDRTEKPRRRAPRPTKPSRVSPYEIQRMYEAGVDLYAQGRLSESANMFQRILDVDPKNSAAKRGLRRVQSEILEQGR